MRWKPLRQILLAQAEINIEDMVPVGLFVRDSYEGAWVKEMDETNSGAIGFRVE
jgi:hypothetical protein